MIDELPTLPARRRLGNLADIRPTVIIDTREQDPLPIRRLSVLRAALQTGDYSFAGGEELFAVERKTIVDLIGCCCGGRERFERELHRLRGYRFKRLVFVGSREEVERGGYRSSVRPASVLHSLAAWEVRFDVPVVWCPDAAAAAEQVEAWVFWFAREVVKNANALLPSRTASAAEVIPLAARSGA